MKKTAEKLLLKRRYAARIAGIGLIIMTLVSFFAYGYAHGKLVVQGDAAATFHNIASSAALFKAEIFGWVLILAADVMVAWAFYLFLEPIHRELSLLGFLLRLIYTAILAVALLPLVLALLLSSRASTLTAVPTEYVQPLVLMFADAFESVWSIGLILFGAHLLVIGWLAMRSDRIPRLLGILLLLAAAGYMIVHTGKAFFPQYKEAINVLNLIFMAPMIAGELGFGLWLLFRGGKRPADPLLDAAQ
ncbi:DUF4386 domain-containing protein [Paenibacillus ginsengarvi]|uniref:DUF4386 domain-containing protein n=1 Tax=Paenibacillus ginsengarvi TaxID=400777 RepID=A0A3B0CI04_9BACL|nr:DUF4386 domain-containing protein [Paenibacillus ginsengarvi]RKN83949.1 DUF4386 domain-containing protein [Paenibacillus ginsengarvi]